MRFLGSVSLFRQVRKRLICRSHEIQPMPSLYRQSTDGLMCSKYCSHEFLDHLLCVVKKVSAGVLFLQLNPVK